MIFSTPIFIYFFLPPVLILYFVLGRRNSVLLAASLVFYYWGETYFTLLLLVSIGINYLVGRMISAANVDLQAVKTDRARKWLTLGIVANLVLLFVFKYSSFALENINMLVSGLGLEAIPDPKIHLPLGISFFTFQAMSYLIDVYRGEVKAEKDFSTLALYISMFPQLVAGPIVRYQEIADQLHERRWRMYDFIVGVERFVIGLVKKVVFADPLGKLADQIFSASGGDMSSPVAWVGVICFTLQIYYDFSGYSDMAIGLGRMMGFRFPENFAHPYKSRSIQEFWRRWHMTLSRFFRDYLYIPLGGSQGGVLRTYANLWIVFLLCGLWHGASWTFVIWGVWHGMFLILERTFFGRLVRACPVILQHFYLMLTVIVGWVFFRADSLSQALDMLGSMFSLQGWSNAAAQVGQYANNYELFLIGLGALLSLPLRRHAEALLYRWRRRLSAWQGTTSNSVNYPVLALAAGRSVVYVGFMVVALAAMAASTHQAFIYFRF